MLLAVAAHVFCDVVFYADLTDQTLLGLNPVNMLFRVVQNAGQNLTLSLIHI